MKTQVVYVLFEICHVKRLKVITFTVCRKNNNLNGHIQTVKRTHTRTNEHTDGRTHTTTLVTQVLSSKPSWGMRIVGPKAAKQIRE